MYKYLFGMFFAFQSSVAFAQWDGSERGEIGTIQVTAGHNYGFRVTLENPVSMCGVGSDDWAFLNEDDSNYQTYVSSLLAARFSKTPVKVYTTKLANGYCKIGHIAF